MSGVLQGNKQEDQYGVKRQQVNLWKTPDLEQVDGEFWMDLSREPAAESRINSFGSVDRIQQLIHVVQSEMAVLEQDPATLRHGLRDDAPSVYLLALAHRHGVVFCGRTRKCAVAEFKTNCMGKIITVRVRYYDS